MTSKDVKFNLAVKDLPDVQAEAKKALYGKVVSARVPLCVEISLRTTEGDTMMLETWCLGVYPEQCDPSVRVTYTVYNRMGILLKSLVSVTRVTPAYKLSRRQGPDSYVICYRIYMGEAQLHNLGLYGPDEGLPGLYGPDEGLPGLYGPDEGLPGLYGPDEGLPGLYGPDEGLPGLYGPDEGLPGLYGPDEGLPGLYGPDEGLPGLYGPDEGLPGLYGPDEGLPGLYGPDEGLPGLYGPDEGLPGLYGPDEGLPGLYGPDEGLPGLYGPDEGLPGLYGPDEGLPGLYGPDEGLPGLYGPDEGLPGLYGPDEGLPGLYEPDEGLPGLYRPDDGLPGLYRPDQGEGYKQVRVGQLCTPVGTIHLSVSYRTKMTISPQNTGRDSILVKSDHFHPDLSPRHLRYQQSEENCASLSETIKVGAFADSCHPAENPLDTDLPTVPFSSLLTPRQQSPLQSTPVQPEGNAPEDDGNGNITPRCHSTTDSRRSSVSANDDFIMVDLKTPFAGGNSNSDLGAFYRECQTAPQLKTFSEQPTLAEQVEYISKTLEVLETNVPEYDDMLSSLCITEN
uniref:Autophagy-related protein 13 n=1 Tax=Timema tahoe TaxID=61484 RepID=A0A7R9IIL8_9NEOP|nr:unnamed protein product [Timema tahoe]